MAARPVTSTARVVSLQVGRAASLPWRGRRVASAIDKRPVDGPLELTAGGFVGDEQADRSVHGGPDKAVCVYPVEHLPAWSATLGQPLGPGAFGENVSSAGLLEVDVHVGDVLRLGTALVQVAQPRGPCFKLAARWRAPRLPGEMARAGISGWYLRVLEEGRVAPGDAQELVERSSDVSIDEVMRVTYRARADVDALRAVLAVPALADQWRVALETLERRAALPIRDFGTDEA